jgi:2-polyprenyl-3-methyl-5-hydroxy-6-metoxy-1,4-benzoquinol methylase
MPLDFSSKRCFLCDCAQFRSFTALAYDGDGRSRVNILECLNCTFAWQYPIGRSEEESVSYFSQSYVDSASSNSHYFAADYKQNVAKAELEFVSSLPIDGRRLLDVGGGSGAFALEAAKLGWQATVVDPALELKGLDNAQVRAIRGSIDDLQRGEQFDVVTAWDVIEHVSDPFNFLRSMRNLVRVGGWLVIETGNYKSADRVECGDEHWIFQLDHRWYFAPDSLTTLLQQHGFAQLQYSSRVLRPNWVGQASYPGPSIRSLFSSIVRKPLKTRSHFRRFLDLRKAVSWQQAGLGIFCVAAQRTD